MKRNMMISIIMGVLMIISGALAVTLTPTAKIADLKEKINLEEMIPAKFGDWKIDETIMPLQVDPETQQALDKIYNQTIARTYINASGERIMLSIAYGGDQSDNLAIHKPEICYYAQGFEIKKAFSDALSTQYGEFPIKRLMAVKGGRNEPITYWVTVGDRVVLPGIDEKLQQLRYGLTGSVPDGMLIRVSSIDFDSVRAYQLQTIFIRELLATLEIKERIRLVGVTGV